MKTSQLLYLSRYVATAEDIIQEAGVNLEFGDDLSDFKVLCENADGRHPLGLSFDPDFSSVRNGTALWVAGRDQDGRIVCTMSVKLLKLKKVSLLDHLNAKFLTYRPREQRFLTNEPSIQLSERAAVLRGKACYCGELWLAKSHRGGYMTAILPRLVYALALLRWSPDFFFGFMEPSAACKGLAAREGFMNLDQGGISWLTNDGTPAVAEWLVWTTRDDFLFNLRVPLHFLADIYNSGFVPKPVVAA